MGLRATGLLRIAEDDTRANTSDWTSLGNYGTPVGQYQSESRNLKRDQKGLVEAIFDKLARRPVTRVARRQ